MSNVRFTHAIPTEFSVDERWLKYFPPKAFKVLAVTGGITASLYKILEKIGHPLIGIIMGGIMMIVCTAPTMIPITDYLKGGGQTLDVILIRRLIRKHHRVIYVRGCNPRKKREGRADGIY